MKTISKIPVVGDTGEDVSILQDALRAKGYSIVGPATFGPQTLRAVVAFQKSFGSMGSGLIGPVTLEKLGLKLVEPIPDPVKDEEYFGAPWIFANIDLLGRKETDKELNARYVPEWKLEGLPNYKTLSGNDYAWCSVRMNADRRKVGVKGTNSAAAASWSNWGVHCPFWFGAALDIRHESGGRHVCDFLYWLDDKKRIAATLDGNRGNLFCVAQTDLSGSGDTIVTGPRWSAALPQGQFVSKAQVLSLYPFLKVGGVGSSTR